MDKLLKVDIPDEPKFVGIRPPREWKNVAASVPTEHPVLPEAAE